MDKGYFYYLTGIVLIILLFIAVLAVTMAKRRKKGNAGYAAITCGSVSVFFDDQNNAVIIPYVKDRFGVGRATAGVFTLTKGLKPEKLGGLLRASMLSCAAAEYCTDNELMSALGCQNWVDFSERKRSIAVHFWEGIGVVFNTTTKRNNDGAYDFNFAGSELVMPPDADNTSLGRALLYLLPRCRC